LIMLYDSWIYQYVLNTKWFMWTIVVTVLGSNILLPVWVWLLTSGRIKLLKPNKPK